MNPEQERIKTLKIEDVSHEVDPWTKWGPYVSERGWGTVREDYSPDGDAWSYFTHEDARFRTYRRAEDGIAGISDRYQTLLFAPTFWNGADSILKERLFGLNPHEGNHGEDVKEYYYHLDATPTQSYLKYLYKYPQTAYPYARLLAENRRRDKNDREFELIDTGIFDENRYFDIFIEYGKNDPDDICIQITAINRGPEKAQIHLIPHLWFRNQWAWGEEKMQEPTISIDSKNPLCLVANDEKLATPKLLLFDYHLNSMYFYAPPEGTPLFTNNETNRKVLWNEPNESPYVKDAFHRYLIGNQKDAINPKHTGTKSAVHYFFPSIGPNEKAVLCFRLTNQRKENPLQDVSKIIEERRKESDLFYQEIHPMRASAEEKAIQRQALAGMIWNKQIYIYGIGPWLRGDNPNFSPPESHRWIRNYHWRHISSYRIFSMPDKWEYPWFAAWDLAFHTVTFSLIDLAFAKQQLWLLLFDQFQHPNGQIPAYEWEFSDVNPPVQAWAALKIFEYEKKKFGVEDSFFLEKCFHKLILNFAWWVNKVDTFGNNIFEGGFLGMDNIAISDRSQKVPGFLLDQADGVGWISLFCLNLTRIALILAKRNRVYEGLATKFFQHFVFVAAAMRKGNVRSYDMFDEKDAFFYSRLHYPDGRTEVRPVRSLEGIIPFFACDVWENEELKQFPEFYKSFEWMLKKRPDLLEKCVHPIAPDQHLFSLLSPSETNRFLKYIWDPNEFRSDYGLRSLSKFHEKNPGYIQGSLLKYEPGEAVVTIKGGNSNWRGPIWFPANYFLIETLKRLGTLFGDGITIEVEGEPKTTIDQMADFYTRALVQIFTVDSNGHRPCFGDSEKFQKDPHFKNHLLFYEYFHGETGRGLGASHQTGWTGLVANLIDEMSRDSQ